jgi:hypothetical protein
MELPRGPRAWQPTTTKKITPPFNSKTGRVLCLHLRPHSHPYLWPVPIPVPMPHNTYSTYTYNTATVRYRAGAILLGAQNY